MPGRLRWRDVGVSSRTWSGHYGCYVNGYGGLRIGQRTIVGPYAMIHTTKHEISLERPIVDQSWTEEPDSNRLAPSSGEFYVQF